RFIAKYILLNHSPAVLIQCQSVSCRRGKKACTVLCNTNGCRTVWRQGYRIVSFIGQCLVSRLEVKGNVASLCSFGRKGRTRRLLTRGIGSTPGAQGLLQTFAIPGERPLRTGYSHQKQKDQRVKCERIMEVMVES